MSRRVRIQPTKIILLTVIGGLSIYLAVSQGMMEPRQAAAAKTVTVEPDQSEPVVRAAVGPRGELTPEEAEVWRLAASADWPDDPFTRVERYSDQSVEDPIPPDEIPDDKRGFVLNAVINGDPPLAMINGRIVGVGGRIDDAIVERIGSYSVRLRSGEEMRTLRIVD